MNTTTTTTTTNTTTTINKGDTVVRVGSPANAERVVVTAEQANDTTVETATVTYVAADQDYAELRYADGYAFRTLASEWTTIR